MTFNWLQLLKNETCVALRRSTKYNTCSNSFFFFFFDYPLTDDRLCLQSSRPLRLQKHLLSAIWQRLSLYPRSLNRLKSNSRRS